jgi:head-tail adaptor
VGSFDQAPANAQPFDGPSLTDPFDTLLLDDIAILRKTQYVPGEGDAYGLPDQTFETVLASWPARVSTNKGGQEYKSGKETAKNTFLVFMRPPSLSQPSPDNVLNTHHWLSFVDEQGATHLLNITAVNDPSFLGHHLECKCEEYLP